MSGSMYIQLLLNSAIVELLSGIDRIYLKIIESHYSIKSKLPGIYSKDLTK
jgi:hypothetical protein